MEGNIQHHQGVGACIIEEQLMKVLEKTHGEEKMDNIKRRKYDIINILENSGIIICHKNEKG